MWAEPIVHLVLGPGYDRSADLLRELTPYVFGSGLSALVAGGVNYLGGARRRVPVALLDLVLSLGLTTVLLQTNGLDGAAWASDVVPFLYVPLHVWIARKFIELPLRPLLRAGARGLLAAAAMAGVLLAFGTSHLSALDWIVGGGLGPTAFLSVLVLLGEVTFAELRVLPALVGGRFGARRPNGLRGPCTP